MKLVALPPVQVGGGNWSRWYCWWGLDPPALPPLTGKVVLQVGAGPTSTATTDWEGATAGATHLHEVTPSIIGGVGWEKESADGSH